MRASEESGVTMPGAAASPEAGQSIRSASSTGIDVIVVLTKLGRRHGLTLTLQDRLLELACGASNVEIARKHGISLNTVKTEVAAVLLMLNCRCRHQLELAATVVGCELAAGSDREALITQVERYLGLSS